MRHATMKSFVTPCVMSVVAVVVFLAVAAPVAGRQPARVIDSERLELTVGKSIVIQSPVAIARASLADPEIADAAVLSPRQIYLTGKTMGGTNLTLWGVNDEVHTVFDIRVQADLADLKEQLHKLFPEEEHLKVVAANDHIALSGAISSAVKLTRVVAVAEAYAPEKVVNLLRVGGVQQVMLEVRVAEMSRDLIRRLGVNLSYVGNNGSDFGLTTLNDLAGVVAPRDAVIMPNNFPTDLQETPFGIVPLSINTILRWQTGGADWTAFIDALKEHGLVKVLAEPTLVSLSGQEASFLAGGEFPFPIPQTFGTITIEFKKFGVGLTFTPTVLTDNLISIKVQPEVSDLDFTRAIVIQGFVIPALTTRRASTVVELADGQSFAIAGLIREDVREKVSKFPLLGDVPVLGSLFRSSEFQKNESELIIIVTPRLVKPIDPTKVRLPTDGVGEPDDLDFYLMGKIEVGENDSFQLPGWGSGAEPATIEETLDGEFGHVEP